MPSCDHLLLPSSSLSLIDQTLYAETIVYVYPLSNINETFHWSFWKCGTTLFHLGGRSIRRITVLFLSRYSESTVLRHDFIYCWWFKLCESLLRLSFNEFPQQLDGNLPKAYSPPIRCRWIIDDWLNILVIVCHPILDNDEHLRTCSLSVYYI